MHILYLSAYDQPGGQSSRTYDMSRELVVRGHQVTIFTNSYCHFTHVERLSAGEKWRVEEIDGVRVVWMHTIAYTDNGWGRGINMLSNVYRSMRIALDLKDEFDVVIGPSVPIGTGLAASIIAKMKGAAFVFEVRDIWPMALVLNGNISKNSFVYYLFRLIETSLYRRAHRISSVLPFAFEHISKSGVSEEKVRWIPNGVALDKFSGQDQYQGGDDNLLTVMYVGGFSTAHDVISIVKAAHILRKNNVKNFKFVLVGSGMKKIECQKLVDELALDNVEFRDRVAKSAIPKLQNEADILVASITDSAIFKFGVNLNKIVDYFASCRPVIFSGNSPNNPVESSGAGISIPPERPELLAEALLQMLKAGPKERMEMGRRALCYAKEHYDIKYIVNRFEELLVQAVRERVSMEVRCG